MQNRSILYPNFIPHAYQNLKLHKIYNESQLKINHGLSEKLFGQIAYSEFPFLSIDSSSIRRLKNDTILTYLSVKNYTKAVTVEDFVFFFNCLPLKNRFKNLTDMEEYLKDMVIFEYLWDEAEKSGFTNREKYVLDRKDFVRETTKKEYVKWVFGKNSEITEDEMLQYYETNIDKYLEGETVICDALLFGDYRSAQDFKTNIEKSGILELDSLAPKGLVKTTKNQAIRFDGGLLPEETKKELFAIEKNKLTYPYPDGKYFTVLWKKDETGTSKIPLEEVKRSIYFALYNKHMQETYDNILKESKEKFDCKNKIKDVRHYVKL